MNDKFLKEILKKDQTTPKRPLNEWTIIESQINKEKVSLMSFFQSGPAVAILSVFLIFIASGIFSNFVIKAPLIEDEITEYLLEDSYFLDSGESYSWLD